MIIKEIKQTILWVVLIPMVILIDFVFYILGIFFKEFRHIFLDNTAFYIIDEKLKNLKEQTNEK